MGNINKTKTTSYRSCIITLYLGSGRHTVKMYWGPVSCCGYTQTNHIYFESRWHSFWFVVFCINFCVCVFYVMDNKIVKELCGKTDMCKAKMSRILCDFGMVVVLLLFVLF